MDKGLVRKIEKIVDQQLIVTLDFKTSARESPFGVVVPRHARDFRIIGEIGISHPDPDPAPSLDDGICFCPPDRRNMLLARDVDALSIRLKLQPVIAAADPVAYELTH